MGVVFKICKEVIYLFFFCFLCLITKREEFVLTLKPFSLSTRDESSWTAEFANSVDLDEVTHNEPPHLDLHCLPFSLNSQYYSIYSLDLTFFEILQICFLVLQPLKCLKCRWENLPVQISKRVQRLELKQSRFKRGGSFWATSSRGGGLISSHLIWI